MTMLTNKTTESTKEDKTMTRNGQYDAIRKALNKMIPYKECNYRNTVIAQAIYNGKEDKLDSTWVMRAMLQDEEDGFITYGQGVFLHKAYNEAIAKLKEMFC